MCCDHYTLPKALEQALFFSNGRTEFLAARYLVWVALGIDRVEASRRGMKGGQTWRRSCEGAHVTYYYNWKTDRDVTSQPRFTVERCALVSPRVRDTVPSLLIAGTRTPSSQPWSQVTHTE